MSPTSQLSAIDVCVLLVYLLDWAI